ncbi:MAG: type II toxin-antitoxin system HicA family toxin [bacterium]
MKQSMHHRLLVLTSKDVEKILRQNGFELTRTKGSHQQFVGYYFNKNKAMGLLQTISQLAKNNKFHLTFPK